MSILFKGNLEEGNYTLIKSTDGWVLKGETSYAGFNFADRPIGEWIPVSERLPESGEYCLVAWVYQHEECPYQHYYGLSSFDTDNPGWNTIGKDDNKIDILAWMPLPEPYREDSEA